MTKRSGSGISASIIVEREQARWQAQTRSRAMLRILAEQVREATGDLLQSPVELLVCVDQAALEGCREFVLATLGRDAELFRICFLGAPGLEYYELKNLGVREAGGDLLIFVDSDVLPEAGWLAHLLAPLSDPSISVVGGNTYVEPT